MTQDTKRKTPEAIQEAILAVAHHPALRVVLNHLSLPKVRVAIAGGMVRDAVLSVMRGEAHDVLGGDLDLVVTGISPEALQSALAPLGAISTGNHFEVLKLNVTVQEQRFEVDVAIGRSEKARAVKEGENVRHAFDVELLTDPDAPDALERDCLRRDMTCNAIMLQVYPQLKVIDPCQGVGDIQKMVIRAPMSMDRSFQDDPLRLMRVLVRVAKDGYDMRLSDVIAMRRNVALLDTISAERIRKELLGIMGGKHAAKALRLMYASRVIDQIFPIFEENRVLDQENDHHSERAGRHMLSVACAVRDVTPLGRLAALLHDAGKARTKVVSQKSDGRMRASFINHEDVGADLVQARLTELRFPTSEIEYVCNIIRLHMRPPRIETAAAARRLSVAAGNTLQDLMAVCRADRACHPNEDMDKVDAQLAQVATWAAETTSMPIGEHAIALSGHDLMQLGVKGKQIGVIKRALADEILEGTLSSDKQTLFARAQEMIRQS